MIKTYWRLEQIEKKANECGIQITKNPLQATNFIVVHSNRRGGWHLYTADYRHLFVVFAPEQPVRPEQKISNFVKFLKPSFLR